MALNSALKEGLGVWSRQAIHLGLICLLDAEASNCARPCLFLQQLHPLNQHRLSWEAGALGSFRHSHLQELHCHVFHPVQVLIAGLVPFMEPFLLESEGRWGALAVWKLCC